MPPSFPPRDKKGLGAFFDRAIMHHGRVIWNLSWGIYVDEDS